MENKGSVDELGGSGKQIGDVHALPPPIDTSGWFAGLLGGRLLCEFETGVLIVVILHSLF